MDRRYQSGFTLIELLVVVAIIGLLASLITLSLGTSRIRSRDARRQSDIQQFRSGLDLYLNEVGGYPDASEWVVGNLISCGSTTLFTVPKDPAPTQSYTYTGTGTSRSTSQCGVAKTTWSSYKLGFTMESDSTYGPAGSYCLRPVEGITAGACP